MSRLSIQPLYWLYVHNPDSYHHQHSECNFLFSKTAFVHLCLQLYEVCDGVLSPRQALACWHRDTEEPAREKVYSWWQLIRAAEAVTLSLHFSWAVDWQDSQRCRSSLNPSSQGPSVFLQNHRTPVGQQTSILSPCKGISVFFYLTNLKKGV